MIKIQINFYLFEGIFPLSFPHLFLLQILQENGHCTAHRSRSRRRFLFSFLCSLLFSTTVKVRKYFPADSVVSGMLNIYSEMLGLIFTEIEKDKKNVWDSSVLEYSVTDKKTNELHGTLYLGIHSNFLLLIDWFFVC